MNVMTIKELKKGEFLYSKGDPSPNFYFVLKGRLEIVVDSQHNPGDFKLSKNIDEYDFFGLKHATDDPKRHDYARVLTEAGAWIICIDKGHYESIVKKT